MSKLPSAQEQLRTPQSSLLPRPLSHHKQQASASRQWVDASYPADPLPASRRRRRRPTARRPPAAQLQGRAPTTPSQPAHNRLPSMQLRVRGPEGQATLTVEDACSVAAFRALLAEKTGVPAERQEVRCVSSFM